MPHAGDETRLAIIIVSFNTGDALLACLRSLHEPAPAVSHRIHIVDNGSHDDSIERVRVTHPDVEVIEMGYNAGFATAVNVGVRASRSELVLLLNSDTLVPPASLDRLVTALDADASAGAAGPRLVAPDGRTELSFGRMMSPWNEARQKLLGRALAAGLPPATWWLHRWTTTPHYPDWVSGACLLVRRAAGDAVGWLDERYFLYGEDVDLCGALRASGRRILFTPDAELVHAGGQSGSVAPDATRIMYRRSQLAFYTKHHPRWLGPLRWYLSARGQLPPAERPVKTGRPTRAL